MHIVKWMPSFITTDKLLFLLLRHQWSLTVQQLDPHGQPPVVVVWLSVFFFLYEQLERLGFLNTSTVVVCWMHMLCFPNPIVGISFTTLRSIMKQFIKPLETLDAHVITSSMWSHPPFNYKYLRIIAAQTVSCSLRSSYCQMTPEGDRESYRRPWLSLTTFLRMVRSPKRNSH